LSYATGSHLPPPPPRSALPIGPTPVFVIHCEVRMLKSLKLPFTFDPARLKADVDALLPDDWVPHFNTSYYEGDWSGAALRSVGGVARQLYPDPTAVEDFADTSILARCPYMQEVLATFECHLQSVRLLRLAARSSIREHKDFRLGFEDGEVRLHVPVYTNPDVAFFLDGERLDMREGECWYLNLNLRHRVENQSATDRVHLVIDCTVNDWLRSLFPQEMRALPVTPRI
ncbi:MAG TPA: aspartyl/asparaginyl beta-hydroxylase domain-containing protein, partial [Herpetosiphonaceae bacterium]